MNKIHRARLALKLIFWCVRHGDIFIKSSTNKKLKIVTAADYSHQISLNNLLGSLEKYEPEAEVVVYDLGMTQDYLEKLTQRYGTFNFKHFPWSEYPDFMNIKMDAGHYAWKPAIIAREFTNSVDFFLWMDAGNVITGRLRFLRKVLRKYGFFSPYSLGTVKEWTHPSTILNFEFDSLMLNEPNLSANVIGVSSDSKSGRSIIETWTRASTDESLIAPLGSNRANHRQDQSILTLVYYKHKSIRYGSLGEFPRRIFKILVHQDAD